jgi:hypothetical protein
MDVTEAKINKEWAVRMLVIAIMFIGGGCWFVYDGAVAWPAENDRYAIYKEILDQGDQADKSWQEVFQENGWSTRKPPKEHSETDILTQFIIASLCFPIGLLALIWLLLNARRSVVADDQAVTFAGKQMRYDEITDIDKSRWDSKGIVVLISGEQRMKLDDWKFRGVKDVLERVEQVRSGGVEKEEPVA